MGNSIKTVVSKLRDPYLVRRVQEAFGLKVIESSTEFAVATAGDNPTVNGTEKPQVKDGLKHRGGGGGGGGGKNNNKGISNGAILSLAVRAIKKKKRTKRKSVAHFVLDSPPSSPEGGSTPPPEPAAEIDVETYPLLDNYFKFVTLVGYEPFFITFLPYLIWNMDILIARRMCLIWTIAIYIGGVAKNVFKWVRPASPPAIRLEDNPLLEQEYGFPSTHAVIASVFSFYWLYTCYDIRYNFFYPMLIISLLWALSVGISRVYLGVHTVMDVVGGSFIALVCVIAIVPFLEMFDSFLFNNEYFIPITILVTVLFTFLYPTNEQWSIDRGDTLAIVGATLGIMFGCHLNGPHADDLIPGPFVVNLPSSQEMGFHMLRFIVGVLLVFPMRFVMKLLCFRLLPAIMPDHGILEVQKRPFVEVPYKLITYTSLGFTVCYVCPIVFELCQISRIN